MESLEPRLQKLEAAAITTGARDFDVIFAQVDQTRSESVRLKCGEAGPSEVTRILYARFVAADNGVISKSNVPPVVKRVRCRGL
jgi:hypothetical protein